MVRIFLLTVFIGLQPSPVKTPQQQAPTKQKNNATKPTPSSAAEPTSGISTQVSQSSTEAQTDNSHHKSRELPPWTDAFYSDWILILITGFAVGAALKTLGQIREQTVHIKGQLDEMKTAGELNKISTGAATKNAEAALLTAQTMVNAERAWIEIELAEPTTRIDEWGEEIVWDRADSPNTFFRYGINLTNHGRTVARILSYRIWHDCFMRDFFPDKFSAVKDTSAHMLLAANQSFVIGNFDVEDMFNDWPNIHNGTKTGIVRIDVRYEDIIRGEAATGSVREPHETTAIFAWSERNEVLTRLAHYNNYS